MKLKTLSFLSLILSLTISVSAQKTDTTKPVEPAPKQAKLPPVKDVIDKYVKAVGGRDAIQKVKSRTAVGTVELVPMNMKGTFEIYAAPEGKSFSKTTIAGIGDLIEGTDGTIAWAVNPIQGSREKSGVELAQSKLTNDFYRDLRLEKLFPKMELKGIEKVGEKDAYAIVATADGLPPETWYIDTQTGLMLRSDLTVSSPEGSQAMSFFYEDYRSVDGINVPFRIRSQTPSFTIVLNFTDVKLNVAIDESKFARPKQ